MRHSAYKLKSLYYILCNVNVARHKRHYKRNEKLATFNKMSVNIMAVDIAPPHCVIMLSVTMLSVFMQRVIMLGVTLLYCYAECRHADCHIFYCNAECWHLGQIFFQSFKDLISPSLTRVHFFPYLGLEIMTTAIYTSIVKIDRVINPRLKVTF
jgi:hypothetical protein